MRIQMKHMLFCVTLSLLSCSDESGLSAFSSDGCSLFPDASLINADDWCSCCFEHDLLYWRGGTAHEREIADVQLQQCVLQKTNDAVLANVMFEGVRLGGSPYFYNWYRWGYGWNYDRKYQALSQKELERANQLLDEYFSTNTPIVCD